MKESYDRPRDRDLGDKLKEETPGILAWLVRGVIKWQRQGLNPPAIVTKTTEKYRFNEDVLANFLFECCETPEKTPELSRIKCNDIHKTFRTWYEAAHGDLKYCPKKSDFGKAMDKRFKRDTKGGHIWFNGVMLKPNDDNQFELILKHLDDIKKFIEKNDGK